MYFLIQSQQTFVLSDEFLFVCLKFWLILKVKRWNIKLRVIWYIIKINYLWMSINSNIKEIRCDAKAKDDRCTSLDI